MIATSTKVDLSNVKVPAKFDDKYFARTKKEKRPARLPKTAEKPKTVANPQRKKDQEELDAGVLAAVKNVPQLARYLNAKFSLRNGQFPHEIKF